VPNVSKQHGGLTFKVGKVWSLHWTLMMKPIHCWIAQAQITHW